MTLLRMTIVGSAALAACGGAIAAAPLKHQELARAAKISLPMARAAALKARPGVITDQELEKERGGSGLRYAFDIKSHGRPYEVGIDARTGAILENVAEGAHPD